MKWRLLIALIGLSLTDAVSTAHSKDAAKIPPTASGLATASEVYAGYLGPSGVVRFQIIQGRVSLDAPRHRKGARQSDAHGVYESVSVTANRGIPSVHYVSQTAKQHLVLSVQNANQMRIESWLPQQNVRCLLNQPPDGPIKVSLYQDDAGHPQMQWHGSTLVHVRLKHPRQFDEHFGRLIERMLHGNSLQQLCQRTRASTIQELKQPASVTEARIQTWINQLASSKRSERILAQRHLLAGGTPIVPVLRARLLPASLQSDGKLSPLDSEQRGRVQFILRKLRGCSPDRPRSLAKLLVNDPSYWALIMPSLPRDQQQLVGVRHAEFYNSGMTSSPVTRIARQP